MATTLIRLREKLELQDSSNFLEQNLILDLCKGVHCVDLGESFQTLFKRIFSRERAL